MIFLIELTFSSVFIPGLTEDIDFFNSFLDETEIGLLFKVAPFPFSATNNSSNTGKYIIERI